MRYGVALLLGAILIMGYLGESARAESSSVWLGEPLKVISEIVEAAPTTGELTCAGSSSRVQMVGEDAFRTACVYGTGAKPRVARLVNLDGQFEYAISFAHERSFYPLESLCVGLDRCAYSQAEDVLLHKALLSDGTYTYRFIKNFSKQVQRVEGQSVSYRAQGLEGDLLLEGASMTTLGISSNGRWAVIEVARKGIVRLDFHTGQVGWIGSLVVSGATPQPILGLAISNDGRWIASTGWYQGLTVYEVTESCGQPGAFTQVTQWCQTSSIVKSELFPGYVRAYRPAFSGDGMRVSLLLVKQQGTVRITVTPASKSSQQGAGYIALGDSYTSGEGELADSFYLPETNSSTNHCHVSTRSYPLLLGDMWNMPATNMACSGSRIPDVRQRLSQLNNIQPVLISLSIGGNDIDLIGKLKSCLGPGTCEWAKEGTRLSTAQEMKRILPDLVQLIEETKLTTGSAVFVVGYPSIIATQNSQCDAVTTILLSSDERHYIEASLVYLNTILKSAAQYGGATFVDISQAFVGERLCEGTQKGMNAVRMGDDIAPLEFLKGVKFIGAESFHPTPFGHQKIAEAIRESYGAFWLAQSCGACAPSVEYPSYWTQGTLELGAALTQIASHFMAGDTFTPGAQYSFSFKPGTFRSASPVRLELHSDVHVLNEYLAEEDGSLHGTVTFPGTMAGYHTIHAIGTSQSGEAIDMYESVYLQITEKERALTPNTAQAAVSSLTPKDQESASPTKISNVASVIHSDVALARENSSVYGASMGRVQAKTSSHERAIRLIGLAVLAVLLVLIILLVIRRKV